MKWSSGGAEAQRRVALTGYHGRAHPVLTRVGEAGRVVEDRAGLDDDRCPAVVGAADAIQLVPADGVAPLCAAGGGNTGGAHGNIMGCPQPAVANVRGKEAI